MKEHDKLYKYAHPGQPRKYSPSELWEVACKYFDWVDSHSWSRPELIKSGADVGKIVEVPLKLPYTIEGFQIFANVSNSYLRDLRADKWEEYSAVIERIYKIVEGQQFDGATVGLFNHHIIARKLGLVDKTTISTPEGEEIKVNAVTEHKVIFENYDDSNV